MLLRGINSPLTSSVGLLFDVVASLLPYDRYVTAETVLSMSQVRGNLGSEFRSSEQAKGALDDLRRAQAEAEVRCF